MLANAELSFFLSVITCFVLGLAVGDFARRFAYCILLSRALKKTPDTEAATTYRLVFSKRDALPPARLVAMLAGGISYVSVNLCYGLSFETLEFLALIAVLLVLTFTDLEDLLIPNGCIVAALLIRVAYLSCVAATEGLDVALNHFCYNVASLVGVMFALVVVLWVMNHVTHSDGMGGGDVKLFGVASFYFGWQSCIGIVCLSCILGLVFYIVRKAIVRKKGDVFPLGPSIAVSCWLTLIVQSGASLISLFV